MTAIKNSSAFRGLAVLILLVCALLSGVSVGQLFSDLPYAQVDDWQHTAPFHRLLLEHQNLVASAAADTLLLQTDDLNYVERQQVQARLENTKQALNRESTPFRFLVRTGDGADIVASNLAPGDVLSALSGTVWYAAFRAGDSFVCDSDSLRYASYSHPSPAGNTKSYIIECAVPDFPDGEGPFQPAADRFLLAKQSLSNNMSVVVFGAAAAALCLLLLLWSAGHVPGQEEIALSWQEKIWLEIWLCIVGAAGFVILAGMFNLADWLHNAYYYSYGDTEQTLIATAYWGMGALTACGAGTATLLLRTLAVRLKGGVLLESTLTFRAIRSLWRGGVVLVRSIPFLWRAIAGFLAYFFLNILLATRGDRNGFCALLWLAVNIVVLLLLCRWVISFRRLRLAGQAIASGNLSHQIDTRHMPGDLRAHAQDLNNLSLGMAEAVEERMKSERFKAELITNVSHDLKTPLTSIINYVNLLKTTEQTDPKAAEYIEVLDRKSQRLKKLTEDLVEASKASTGVLNISRDRIGFAQLLDQALGEWSEKLEARRLMVVTSLPEGETWVYADGRHLWRVLDNLLSNCAKYAMEGTRIYLDLSRGHGQVTLSVKNISREPLNLPPERLMERFVRGEESRSTEGSGLGLSIARSLTELQGGTFDVSVDGDLFKATVALPQAN